MWQNFVIDFTCTYESEGVTYVSLLDHFFVSEVLLQSVSKAGVLHHPDNSSDHEPIFCVLESIVLSQSVTEIAPYKPKPSWRMASEEQKEQYKYLLDTRLSSIVIPTQVTECVDVHCQDPVHLEAIDWLSIEIPEGVQDCAEAALPLPQAGGSEGKKSTPGFRTRVQPYKDNAYFWHQVWKSASCPLNSQLHTIMKRTRNRYHMEFKKCQKSENTIKKSNLLDACLNGNGDLFKELKKMRKTKMFCADTIDGVSEDVPGHFRNIYKDLYNCVEDAEEIAEIKAKVDVKITEDSLKDVNKVTMIEARKAAASLKPGKGDPVYSFSFDCLKVDSMLLAEHTAILIKSFLIHSYIPQLLLFSTLVPII